MKIEVVKPDLLDPKIITLHLDEVSIYEIYRDGCCLRCIDQLGEELFIFTFAHATKFTDLINHVKDEERCIGFIKMDPWKEGWNK